MANISPVIFPIVGTATKLDVTVLGFKTSATSCNTYYQLTTDDGVQCIQGNYNLTNEQFAAWGIDSSVVDDYVAEFLGVQIIGEVESLPENA